MVGVLKHGRGTTARLLWCCSTLERVAGERESASESERVGVWRAKGSRFWRGRAGRLW